MQYSILRDLHSSMFTLTVEMHTGSWRIEGLLPSGSLLSISVIPSDPADNTLRRMLPLGTVWIDSEGDPVEPRMYSDILRDGYGLRLPCGTVGSFTVTFPTPIGSLPLDPRSIVTIRGRISHLDSHLFTYSNPRGPRSQYINYSYFRLRLIDATGSIVGTAWEHDRDHELLRVGMDIVVHNAVVRRADPHALPTFDIGRQSVLEII